MKFLEAAAADVTRRVRASAGRDAAVEELLRIYEAAIAEYSATPPARELEGPAAAAHLRAISTDYQLKREAILTSTPFRVTEQLLRTPIVGRVARTFARRLYPQRRRETLISPLFQLHQHPIFRPQQVFCVQFNLITSREPHAPGKGRKVPGGARLSWICRLMLIKSCDL